MALSIDVDGPHPEAACAAFEAEGEEAGGIDLVVLGLGRNGHVGMNEPGSRIDSPTRVVELTPPTRDAAIGYGADPPPTHGVTLGMAPILTAREIWLLATGPEKREILHRVLEGPTSPDVPATLLLGHQRLAVVVDEAAAHARR